MLTAPDPFPPRRLKRGRPPRGQGITDEDRYLVALLRYQHGASIPALTHLTGIGATTLHRMARDFLDSGHEAAETMREFAERRGMVEPIAAQLECRR